MVKLRKREKKKFFKGIKSAITLEMIVLLFICIVVFILSTFQVKDIISIWNQNDEFGVWQGGAWLLGLDWSEVVSTNAYYGYGYGFILAFFLKYFGHNTVMMTHVAIYFQAFIHTICILIAWSCIKRMFPSANAVMRVIGASVCVLTIPDMFYVYMFFSECLLRFIVWVIFGLVVSYSYNRKWYKLLLINLISIYAFSVHQRCVLLVFMAIFFTLYEIFNYLIKNGIRIYGIVKIFFFLLAVVLFYCIEYKYAQRSYLALLYSASGSISVGGNLLSERGYTLKTILRDVFLNWEAEKIAVQNIFGHIYYICAIDCGFVLYGFILCFSKVKKTIILRKHDNLVPYIYMAVTAMIGVFLVVYQYANEGVYERVEMMHYGRYCSYLFSPMLMLGIMEMLTEKASVIRRNALIVIILLLVSGISTYSVLKEHNVTNLFAFANACPGIKSVYYIDNPFAATLYHTILGVSWILFSAIFIIKSKKNLKLKNGIEIGTFIIITIVWINVANREWNEQREMHNEYVEETYDLQNMLKDVDEFVVFKSFSYGSGLLQYNNPFSKIHICQTFDDFGESEKGLLVVSQKGIDEMAVIADKYDIKYENDLYFLWEYKPDIE